MGTVAGWTQPCCWVCWYHHHNHNSRPHTLAHPERVLEKCCWCGEPTISGIYVRVDPNTVPYPQGA